MNIEEICKNKKYLVTGASGFIGRAVCKRLLEMGAYVHGVSRREVQFDSEYWTHSCLDLVNADAVDRLFVDSKPDYLIHLASCVTGKRELEWVRATLAGNLQSAVNVLVAAENNGVAKSVLAGSLEEPEETDKTAVPASPYAASKWCATAYARMMHALYDTKVAVARIFMVYGPGQQDHQKLIPYVCISAAKLEAPKLMSGGRPVDWIYIDDVVSGLIRMTLSGPEDGSYVDLGTGQLVTTGDVAGRICSIAGTGVSPEFGAVPDRAMEQERIANIVATKNQLGWSANTGLDIGLEQTYRWYRQVVLDQDRRV